MDRTIREMDLSVMNRGKWLRIVIWSSHVRVDGGTILWGGWKATECCAADWQRRSTQERRFAFSLHWRLTSFSSAGRHSHTNTLPDTLHGKQTWTDHGRLCLCAVSDLWHLPQWASDSYTKALVCVDARYGNGNERIILVFYVYIFQCLIRRSRF